MPPAGRNLSGSAGARKPSVQDKAQAAERPCAALGGCRTLFRAAHGDRLPLPPRLAALPPPPAKKCCSSAEFHILKQKHTSTRLLPAWKAVEAGSRRGGRCGLLG